MKPEKSEKLDDENKVTVERPQVGFLTSFFSQALRIGNKNELVSLHDLIEPKESRNNPRVMPLRPSLLQQTLTKPARTAESEEYSKVLNFEAVDPDVRLDSGQRGTKAIQESEEIKQSRQSVKTKRHESDQTLKLKAQASSDFSNELAADTSEFMDMASKAINKAKY